jgi:transcriptional regulator
LKQDRALERFRRNGSSCCSVSPPDHLEEAVSPDSSHVQYTLEMLVLKALSLEPMHGWGIGQRIGQLSKGAFEVQQGSLYPALLRMRRRGLIRSEWRRTENNRRARYYVITDTGLRQLGVEAAAWEQATAAVRNFLRLRTVEDHS